jgi:D-aminoacyl-tRNA deacylase
MRAVVQRVKWSRVRVGERLTGEIGPGLLVLLGIGKGDDEKLADAVAKKIAEMRIFQDDSGKMNLSVVDTGGGCLVVSQFTLYADTSRGRRPFFGDAEAPERASALCDYFVEVMRKLGPRVETGEFGAMMDVELCNDGPVTIILDVPAETGG